MRPAGVSALRTSEVLAVVHGLNRLVGSAPIASIPHFIRGSTRLRNVFPWRLVEEMSREGVVFAHGAKPRVGPEAVCFRDIVLMNLQDATKKGNGVNTEKVTARRLTAGDVAELGPQDAIFVSAETDGLPLDCYAPAFLTEPGKNFEGGSFVARTVFGNDIHVLPDNAEEPGIWIADKAGEEIEVLKSMRRPSEPRPLRARWQPGIPGRALLRRTGCLRRGDRPALERGHRRGAGRQGRPVRGAAISGRGRARTIRTATVARSTSTRPACGSWSPATAGSSSSSRTRRSSTTPRRSDLMAG